MAEYTPYCCEQCNAPAPVIQRGPFAGSTSMHDDCAHCAQNLCDACHSTTPCSNSPDEKHHKVDEEA